MKIFQFLELSIFPVFSGGFLINFDKYSLGAWTKLCSKKAKNFKIGLLTFFSLKYFVLHVFPDNGFCVMFCLLPCENMAEIGNTQEEKTEEKRRRKPYRSTNIVGLVHSYCLYIFYSFINTQLKGMQ